MFTGIVMAVGRLREAEQLDGDTRLVIDTGRLSLVGAAIGDSIAVNGVCLTVTRIEEATFVADVSRETLGLTTLGELRAGTPLNLETALRAGDPLGGHYVSGHIDGVACVIALTFAPQLVTDAARVRAAHRLRGRNGTGLRSLRRLAMPVL